MVGLEIAIISKELTLKEFLMSCCSDIQMADHCEPIILSIGHFESSTEVQLKSW